MRRQGLDFSDARLIEVGDPPPGGDASDRWSAMSRTFSASQRLAVPGNHDWADSNAAGFFSISSAGAAHGRSGRPMAAVAAG